MSTSPPPPASKREALLALLDRGLVMIHVDARRPGVAVPSYLTQEHHLRLNLSYRFELSDMVLDDWGVQATLAFKGAPFHCRIPWTAVFAMTQPPGERGWLWPGDLSPELLATLSADTSPSTPTPRLVSLPELPNEPTPGDDPPPTDEPPTPSRPHLRLVK